MIIQEGIVVNWKFRDFPMTWRRIKIGWGDLPVIKFYKSLGYAKRSNKYLEDNVNIEFVNYLKGCISTKELEGYELIEEGYAIKLKHGSFLQKIQGTAAPQTQVYSEAGAKIAAGRMKLEDYLIVPVFVYYEAPVGVAA